MIMKKLIGQVTVEEKNDIQALFERRNGLNELAKILIVNVEKNPRMTMGEVIAETKKIISNTKDFSDKQQEEIESDIALEEEEDEYSNDGPWRNSTRPL